MRKSGVLMPVASLPGKYGIGTFGKSAYQFVDRLREAGQSYWQMLPLVPTSYGDSPYQSASTFAGNPYFIDLETLVSEGLLDVRECDECDFGDDPHSIDYAKLYESRFDILRVAFTRSDHKSQSSYKKFVKDNSFWLDDYALFMAIKDSKGGVSFTEWEDDIRLRREDALKAYRKKYKDEINFYKFLQYEFNKQWKKIKSYANKKGIKLIGDLPIYIAEDSADFWANPKLFQVDRNGRPKGVAGCPPDAFSATGQLWGNPLYDWSYHRKTGYAWWTMRMAHMIKLYDVVRIDHFRGFDEYYSIPYGEPTAQNGKWKKGPGMSLFNELKDKLGEMDIIAEDLGYLTKSVIKLVTDCGYPGMKVLQFAFDSREESDYLPHNYSDNCIVYTGTHDNNTVLGWYRDDLSDSDRDFANRYMNIADHDISRIPEDFIRLAMGSVAKLCIIPIQDYLGLGSEARINRPSTIGINWKWRMDDEAFSAPVAERMYKLTKMYARL